MQSDLEGPTNIGTEEYVSVAELVQTVIEASGKEIHIEYVEGPVGVQARNAMSRATSNRGSPVSSVSALKATFGIVGVDGAVDMIITSLEVGFNSQSESPAVSPLSRAGVSTGGTHRSIRRILASPIVRHSRSGGGIPGC